MTYEATEYGFIKISNQKAVGLRPATHAELTAILAPSEIGQVLQNLATAGWQLSPDNKFTGNEFGSYELKIERSVQLDEREDPNYDYIKIAAQEPLDQLQNFMEKKGYNLIGIFRLPGQIKLRLTFRRPRGKG